MKYEDLVSEWLMEKKKFVKDSTYALYEYEMHRYIVPILGELILDQIKESDLQDAVLQWQQMTMKNGNRLKTGTLRNLVMLVKQTLSYATRKEYRKTFSALIFFPKGSEQKQTVNKPVFNSMEQKKLLQYIENHLTPKAVGIAICLNAGLRIGEICALRWRDVDLNLDIISVTKTIQRIYNIEETPHTAIILSSPKSESAVRSIPITQKIHDMLIKLPHKDLNTYILSGSERIIEPRCYRKFYYQILEKAEIPYRKFHSLRHTFATNCVASGGDYKCISEILGHSSIKITLDMYVHPQMDEKRHVIEKMALYQSEI